MIFTLFAGAMQGLVAAGLLLLSGRSLRPTSTPDQRASHGPSLPPVSAEGEAPSPDAADDAVGAEAASGEAPEPVGKLKMPFGPFLALGALEFLFFGEPLMRAYFGLFAH